MNGNVGARYTSLLLTLFVVVGLCAGGVQQMSSHPWHATADETTPTISIIPADQTVSLGAEVTINISIESNEPLTGAQVDVTFDPTILQVSNVSDGGMFDSWGPDLNMSYTVDNTAGRVNSIMAIDLSGSGITSGTLATVTFEAIKEGTTQVTVEDPELFDAEYEQVPEGNINIVPGTISTASIVAFDPTPAGAGVGEPVSVNVTLKPAEPVQTMQFNVTFNTTYLQATDVQKGDLFGQLVGAPVINNTTGVISNIVLMQPGGATTLGTVVTVTFTPLVTGMTTIDVADVLMLNPSSGQVTYAAYNGTIIIDGTPPNITDLTGDTATTGDDFTFTANVTDNMAVGEVYVEYWYGDGTHYNESMQPGSDYMKTITVADTTENLNYMIAARDTSGNWNHTETSSVTITDNDSPTVTSVKGDVTIATGESVVMWATGTDNIDVTAATITIDGTDYTMTWNGTAGRWEYTYVAPADETGDYTYTVTMADEAGNTGTTGAVYTITVIDEEDPVITGTSGNLNVGTGNTVTLWATGTDNVGITEATVTLDGTDHAMAWDAGQSRWEYTYNAPSGSVGTSDYTVTVSDAAGNTATSSTYTITVSDDDAPSLSLSGPSGTIDTDSVSFSWSGSDNIGGVEYSYMLEGRDGAYSSWGGATSNSYSALDDGSYTFMVRARDGAGNMVTRTTSFTVDTNTPPTASFTYSPSGPTDLDAISFTSTSTDTDGDIVNYTWSFGDGTKAYGATATHTYEDNATYTVKLTVEDDKGDTDTETKQITVANEPPTAVIRTEPAEKAGIDEEILFNSTLSSDEDGTIASYAWDFGDGNTSTLANPTHAYEEDGDYTVTLTVTDNDGDTDTTTVTLTVEEDQPDYLLPILAIIILVVIAIIVVLVWRRRSMGSE